MIVASYQNSSTLICTSNICVIYEQVLTSGANGGPHSPYLPSLCTFFWRTRLGGSKKMKNILTSFLASSGNSKHQHLIL